MPCAYAMKISILYWAIQLKGTKLKNLRPFETRELFFKCQLHGKNEHSWNQHIIDLENFIN